MSDLPCDRPEAVDNYVGTIIDGANQSGKHSYVSVITFCSLFPLKSYLGELFVISEKDSIAEVVGISCNDHICEDFHSAVKRSSIQ